MDMHESWKRAVKEMSRVQEALGPSIYDHVTTKTFDCGQAVAREMFGPDWGNEPAYHAFGQAEECGPEFFEAVQRLVNKEPSWLRPSPDDGDPS